MLRLIFIVFSGGGVGPFPKEIVSGGKVIVLDDFIKVWAFLKEDCFWWKNACFWLILIVFCRGGLGSSPGEIVFVGKMIVFDWF